MLRLRTKAMLLCASGVSIRRFACLANLRFANRTTFGSKSLACLLRFACKSSICRQPVGFAAKASLLCSELRSDYKPLAHKSFAFVRRRLHSEAVLANLRLLSKAEQAYKTFGFVSVGFVRSRCTAVGCAAGGCTAKLCKATVL